MSEKFEDKKPSKGLLKDFKKLKKSVKEAEDEAKKAPEGEYMNLKKNAEALKRRKALDAIQESYKHRPMSDRIEYWSSKSKKKGSKK